MRGVFGEILKRNLMIFFELLPFLYPATLKSAGCYVIPSVQKFALECPGQH